MNLGMIVNGHKVHVEIDDNERLIDVLRNRLHLTGTKMGCQIGECGACTVIIEGQAVNSCLVLAASAMGKSITTIEGLETEDGLHPIQKALVKHHAFQCGFCTPGFIMSAKAFLDSHPTPTPEEIKMALSGNLCRCTGYKQIEEAVLDAAKERLNSSEK